MHTSRRDLFRHSATAALATAVPAWPLPSSANPPVPPGLASYTFRNFPRAQMIGYMKQLGVSDLNAKEVKDHLPTDVTAEAEALAAYRSSGIQLHAVGTVYFPKDEDGDIRAKFDYARRAGVKVIVSADPAPTTLPRLERFVKEYDIKLAIHNHGPEDPIWKSPLDVLAQVKNILAELGAF